MISIILLSIETEEERYVVEQIFNLYFAKMMAKADDVLKNKEDAKDAAMNVIGKIATNPSNYMDYRAIETINRIIYITQNEAIDIYRRNKRRNDRFVDVEDIEAFSGEDSDENIPDIVINKETQEILQKAINELKEKYRSVIIMHYALKMKNSEIAEELGIEVSNVGVIMHRARKMLRKKMLKKGYVE